MRSHAHSFYLIPGSYRPPHKGHYDMIRHFISKANENDKIIVFISNPSDNRVRRTGSGNIISPQYVKSKFEKVFGKHKNISFVISEKSPVTDCYEFGHKIDNGNVIFCCGNKNDDIKRFDSVKTYYLKKFPNINVSVEPFEVITNISSSSIRLRL